MEPPKYPGEFTWREKVLAMRFAKDPDVKISIEEANAELQTILDQYEWYYDTRIEGKSICAYVYHMNSEIISLVPRVLYGHHVSIAFASYLTCGEKYGAKSPIVRTSSFDYTDE